MCGLAGVLFPKGTPITKDLLAVTESVFQKASLRGEDSSGFWVLSNGISYELRLPHAPSSEFSFDTYIGDRFNKSAASTPFAFVGAARAYPTEELVPSEVKSEAIAPFLDQDERFVVVHNGLIHNDESLRRIIKIYYPDLELSPDLPDTAVVPHLLSRYVEIFKSDPSIEDEGLEAVRELVRVVKGSFAFIIFDVVAERLYAVTNFMPLYQDYIGTGIFFGSLPNQLLGRSVHQIQPYTINYVSNSQTVPPTVISESFKPVTEEKKVVVSFSGGLDSTTNARLYQALGYDVHLVNYEYGQAAAKVEQAVTRRFAKQWGMECVTINVEDAFRTLSQGKSKLLTQTKPDEEHQHLDAESTFSYVPNRNMIFASMAAGYAEMIGAERVVVNMNLGDSKYPDNGLPFMVAVNKALQVSLNQDSPRVRFTSPLINLEKWEIVKLGSAVFADWQLAVSCYYPKMSSRNYPMACGKCGSCQTRYRAFHMAGYQDASLYAVTPKDVLPDLKPTYSDEYADQASKPFVLSGEPAELLPTWRRISQYI